MPYSPPASCKFWCKADAEIYTNGQTVTVIHDQSGNGNDTTSATGTTTFATNIVNSLSAFSFPGSAWYALPSGVTNFSDWSLMAVINLTGDSIIMGGLAFNKQVRYGESGGNTLAEYDGNANPISGTLGVAQGNWCILEWIRSGTTVSFYQNGTAYSTGSDSGAGMYFDELSGILNNGTLPMNGYLAELLLCNAALGSTDRTAMESYLNTKYFGSAADTGSGSASFSFTAAAGGAADAIGSGAASFSFTVTGAGVADAIGSGAASFSFTVAGTGKADAIGSGAATFSFTVTAAGKADAAGSGAASFSFTTTAAGVADAIGSGAASVSFTATGVGKADATGSGAATVSFTATATGAAAATGSGAASFSFTVAGVGTSTGGDTTSGAASFTFSAKGAPVADATGSGAASFSFTATGAGVADAPGSGAAAFSFTVAGAGVAGQDGTGSGLASFGFTAAGVGRADQDTPGSGGIGPWRRPADNLPKKRHKPGPRRGVALAVALMLLED